MPRGLTALCRARLDSVSFRKRLRAQLSHLLAFDAYCVNTVDPESLVITSSIGDGLPAVAARRLFEIEDAGTDFNLLATLARGPSHTATIWQATAGDVSRSERMAELFVPLGFGDELRAALVVDGACWGYLHLFRTAPHGPFSADDVARIELSRTELASALRAACLVEAAPVAPRPPAILLLDHDGAVVAENAATRGWLEGFASDVGASVPHPVHAVAARVRASSAVVTARYRNPEVGWLTLHGSPLNGGVALLLEASRSRELRPLLFAAHLLTPRERQVTELLLSGSSNEDIALTLAISLHTAKDHVKTILHKTGAGTRAGLMAKLAG